MMTIEAMKQAIDFAEYCLEELDLSYMASNQAKRLIERSCQAIAEAEKQEQGEPVAWMRKPFGEDVEYCEKSFTTDWTPLYTAPQPRKQLTDEQTIIDVLNKHFKCVDDEYIKRAAKEIAAHSIKE
jgi:hypothetical protein